MTYDSRQKLKRVFLIGMDGSAIVGVGDGGSYKICRHTVPAFFIVVPFLGYFYLGDANDLSITSLAAVKRGAEATGTALRA